MGTSSDATDIVLNGEVRESKSKRKRGERGDSIDQLTNQPASP